MLEKGFIRKQNEEKSGLYNLVSIISKIMFYLGAAILIGSFGYLIVQWGKNEFLIGMLLPFIIAGLGLVFISRLIMRAYKKLRR